MVTNQHSTSEHRILEIAEEYRRRGYRVTLEPTTEQLPEFLNAFRPSLVAEGPDDSVVVQAKGASHVVGPEYWAALARRVREHPGWRLEMVTNTDPEQGSLVSLGRDEVIAYLAQAQRLMQAGMPEGALLVAWSALEAALRLVADATGVEAPDYRPATVIGRLYMDGVLEREQYDELIQYMRLRNGIAHGFLASSIDSETINRVRSLARELLEEPRTAPEGA